MDIPTLLSLAAIAVALLAALYARWSANAAERQAAAAESALNEAKVQTAIARAAVEEVKAQNRIAIHNEALGIFKSFLIFRGKVLARGVQVSESDYFEWFESVRLAEFYFSQDLANEIESMCNRIWKVISLRGCWDVDGVRNTELVKQTYELFTKWRTDAETIETKFRAELRLRDA